MAQQEEAKAPKGWAITHLSNVSVANSGVGFPKKHQGIVDGDIPVYKVGDVSKSFQKNEICMKTSEFYVTEDVKKEMKGKILPVGSTLFAKIGEALRLERRVILGKEGLADNNVMAVTCDLNEMNRFVYQYLRTVKLAEFSRSSTVPSIRKGDVELLNLPLPPLPEQKRIVEKLDSLLAQVDTIQQRLNNLPDIIKRFRQSVLAAAVSGKLTEQWRGSKATDFEQSPITIGESEALTPKGWKWQKLLDLAKLESGHTPRKTVEEYWENGDVYWICLQDIRAAHGTIIKDTKYKPTMLGIENSSARLLPAGTVCFSRDISVGFTTIMGHEMSTTQHFANWICGGELINKYLMFSLMAAKTHITDSGQGTTVKTVYMPALKEFRLLTPPLSEQTEIVRLVEQYFALADTLEKNLANAKQRVDNLTQSILAKAFRGELVPQDPNDEPADKLLARIKAARLEAEKLEKAAKKAAKASKK